MTTYLENITAQNVRDFTGLTATDITDAQIVTILSGAVSTLNADIQVRYDDWQVQSIDGWRENKQDGSNKIFYVPDDKRPIGDYNDEGVIVVSGVKAYVIEGGGTDSTNKKTDYVVSEITDDKNGKITLSSAPPAGGKLYLSWAHTPLEMSTPHPLIKRAMIQLAGAVSFSKVDVGKVSKFKVGKVSVMQQSEAFKKYMDDYKQTVYQIKTRAVRRKDFELIPDGF